MKNEPFAALQKELQPYLAIVERQLEDVDGSNDIPLFYDPIKYVLHLPAKRIRPLLVLLTADMLGVSPPLSAFAAAAVELLHNFTLVHDDIMDRDDWRRGQPTVHTKWDESTAILAGDGMMGLAFLKLLQSPQGDLRRMATEFARNMVVICEGQGKDKMFEGQRRVSEEDYLDMIARKTAALLQLSCELGVMVAEGSEEQISLAGEMGYALGMGFQIQDDILDVIADAQTLGKDIGSDFQMHKQTLLAIKLQKAYPQRDIFTLSLTDFRRLLQESAVLQETRASSEAYFNTAFANLKRFPQNEARRLLGRLMEFIRSRQW